MSIDPCDGGSTPQDEFSGRYSFSLTIPYWLVDATHTNHAAKTPEFRLADRVGDIVQGQEMCIVCHEAKTEGMNIYGKFVCESCEHEIVTTDVSNPRYLYFIECMKEIWWAAIS